MLQIKRVYEAASPADGYRILVDRLWPRGVAKTTAQLDDWNKAITPTTELRRWFDHEPAKFPTFKTRYLAEIADNPAWPAFEQQIRQQLAVGNVTLVYAAKDPEYNHVVILLALLKKVLDS